jgi:hypothetical protein
MTPYCRPTLLIKAAGAALAACSRVEVPPMVRATRRPLSSLPTTELPWLVLRDHLVATVGPNALCGSTSQAATVP